MEKLYTLEELKTKYAGRFIDTYPRHFEKRVGGKWVTVYEVRSVSKTERENHERPERIT
jgi:hypothetical protein